MTLSTENLIWIDLEMTGLDTDNDYIIEIATAITDSRLNLLAEGPVIAINQADSILQAMDEWNTKQHAKSGMSERVRNSRHTATNAETMTLEFVAKFVPPGVSPMCGNSICQDRRFLHRLMPQLEQYFHYRNLDVSSVKELVKRWYPDKPQFNKESTHRAMDDIRDSINELRFYRENYFNNP
ncbi:MAG: oligoribonuclease [Gammaproteobacteria bacterium RIFCSPLOWO2_02_47_7]|jgi:oligoribonuclease|nr:MAG: oligoribonuclease [Gammaproteobacteria bacterium RIFCSPLOWO2_02_47_7]OGT75026.1 MAG: oligoribonuclease [Gammaproteobacteria bacterium RIFCSPLOWO2_12_47_11]